MASGRVRERLGNRRVARRHLPVRCVRVLTPKKHWDRSARSLAVPHRIMARQSERALRPSGTREAHGTNTVDVPSERFSAAVDHLRLRRHPQPLRPRPGRQGLQSHGAGHQAPGGRERGRSPRPARAAEQLYGLLLAEAGLLSEGWRPDGRTGRPGQQEHVGGALRATMAPRSASSPSPNPTPPTSPAAWTASPRRSPPASPPPSAPGRPPPAPPWTRPGGERWPSAAG